MKKRIRKDRKEYNLIFTTEFELVTNYLTEAEYFEYYQNACDPTFENYSPNFNKHRQTSEEDMDDLPF